MYRPVTSSNAVIKTQTFNRKGKVFYPSKSDYLGKDCLSVGAGKQQDSFFASRTGSDPAANNLWRTRSSGSNGSSSGTTPTSPSDSSPLSRTSSIGSSHDGHTGMTAACQAAVILRETTPVCHVPVKPVVSGQTAKNKKSPPGQSAVVASRSPKSASKPFNHKEVLEQMDKAFREAMQHIEAGHGKIFNTQEHGPVLAFQPFDWEAFWGQRKMSGL